jgi:UDP-glucose 4-epimerase
MRILLTGATGFIGSHLLAELVNNKIPVAIVLRPEANHWRIRDLLPQVTVISGSLDDNASIEKPILDFAPDTLLHLAWYGVENRFRNEYQQLSTNLTHLTNLLAITDKLAIKKIIGFGSQGEYGPRAATINEDLPPNPTTFYGVAKLCAHNILKWYCEQRQIAFAWIRIFSIYGPKDNSSWLIPMVINEILNDTEPKLTEGKQLWDYLYVTDAARAILAVAQNPCTGIFNLGSGQAVTVKTVVEKIRQYINPAISLGFGQVPYRPDQVMFLQADIGRIKQATGWSPQVNLDEGIQQTIAWCKQI